MDVIMRAAFSMAISLLMFSAPREEYERRLTMLPTPAERAAIARTDGWEFRSIESRRLDIEHTYYKRMVADSLPTLVCLHGFNTDGRVFTRLTGLSPCFNLIALNLPETTSLYTGAFSDFVPIIDDFCAHLDLDTIDLMGLSVGGGIAAHYTASTRAVAVERLFLVSTCICGATEENRKRSAAMADKLLPYPDYKLLYLLTRARALVQRLENTGLGEDAPPELVVIKRIGWYRQILRAMAEYNGAPLARRITIPVLALHGDADRVVPLEQGRTIPALIDHAEFTVFEGAGHSMVYTEGERTAAAILSYCGQARQ
jgi:pimeloyl-ACP methyl ester carboxylesterase